MNMAWRFFAAVVLLFALSFSSASAQKNERTFVFISDTHMGIGRQADGSWYPSEDFRWPKALTGFLSQLQEQYGSSIDLVILGDVLELWQRPDTLKCQSLSGDSGCTVSELLALAEIVSSAHSEDLQAFGTFAAVGSNTITIVPGNHDSALLIPSIWTAFATAVSASNPTTIGPRLTLSHSGRWVSPGGYVVAEHGHQIGKDVNRLPQWPQVTVDNSDRLVRSWGEQFVQDIFNEVEDEYSVIDNLSPESAGARYRFLSEGWLQTTEDIAKILVFSLVETSPKQRSLLLGVEEAHTSNSMVRMGKLAGYRLAEEAAPQNDPLRRILQDKGMLSDQLRTETTNYVSRLSDDEILILCQLADERGHKTCIDPTLGSLANKFRNPDSVKRAYLTEVLKTSPSMKHFIYGHTHEFREPRDLKVGAGHSVTVSNTGAFQRVVELSRFETILEAKNIPAKDALKSIKLDDLPACYTFIVVDGELDGSPILWRWLQKEDEAMGLRVSADDSRCL